MYFNSKIILWGNNVDQESFCNRIVKCLKIPTSTGRYRYFYFWYLAIPIPAFSLHLDFFNNTGYRNQKNMYVIVGLVHLEKKRFKLYSHLIMSIKMHFTSFCDTVNFFALWYFIFNLIICSIAVAQYWYHKTFSCNVKNPLVIVMPINLVTVLKLKLSFLNWVSLTLWVFLQCFL